MTLDGIQVDWMKDGSMANQINKRSLKRGEARVNGGSVFISTVLILTMTVLLIIAILAESVKKKN